MRLPDYSGPFRVGAIDLEIPVRNPRSFGAEYVPNDKINRPSHRFAGKASKQSSDKKKRAKDGAQERAEGGGKDFDEVDEHNKDWNPFTGGSKTSVLHLTTVLFTIFYPTSVSNEDKEERKRYSEVSWMGRPKQKAVGSFLRYLSQYGILAMPAAPALITLVRAQIPALCGAPLADPTHPMARAPPPNDKVEAGNFGTLPARFPLIVFSHGLAGHRLSYSQFCGELASQGVIVCALEHRDGSGIASIVRGPLPAKPPPTDDNDEKRKADKKASSSTNAKHPKLQVPYFAFETVGLRSFAQDPSDVEAGLRNAQLAMREAEIRECLYVVGQIAEGKGEEIAKKSTRGLTSKLRQHPPPRRNRQARIQEAKEEAVRLQGWKGRIDVDMPTLVGHSFGGATVIEMQRKPKEQGRRQDHEEGHQGSERPRRRSSTGTAHSRHDQAHSEPSHSPFPFAVILDPWVEPIQWSDTSDLDRLNRLSRGELDVDDFESDPRPIVGPAYVINSETFTIWSDHFAKLKRIMHDSQSAASDQRGWLMTLCGCQHLDFSDFPLLLPHVFRSTVGPRATITIFCRATYAQMGLFRLRAREEMNLPGIKESQVEGRQLSAKQRKQRDREDIRLKVRLDKELKAKNAEPNPIATKIGRSEYAAGAAKYGPDQQQLSAEREGDEAQAEASKAEFEQKRPALAGRASTRGKSIKDIASERILAAKAQRKEREWRKRIVQERRERGLVATVAKRTPSGNFHGEEIRVRKGKADDRTAEEKALAAIDYSHSASDVCDDPDADTVQRSLSDVVQKLDYKKAKVHSLMGFVFRIKGVRPGLDQPGKVLVHEI